MQQTAAAASDAMRRAEAIYSRARAQIDVRLWHAALGGQAPAASAGTGTGTGMGMGAGMSTGTTAPTLAFRTLLGLEGERLAGFDAFKRPPPAAAAPRAAPVTPAPPAPPATPATPVAQPLPAAASGMGRNAGYSASIDKAASRAGIPAAVLASIINAEAAKSRDGQWVPTSRNARSTATGLGQFLSGTWQSEAERAGTWLNGVAHANGWIGAAGKLAPAAREALLALRNDADASINATADLARHSLGQLARAGVSVGTSLEQIARAAYLGHNLGIGDAITFLRGGLSDARAQHLLDAQVGTAAAARRIADAGGAGVAHRNWLIEFMDHRLDIGRFMPGKITVSSSGN